MSGRPGAVPDHLRHLPVVGGLPVPYVTIWSAERDPALVVVRGSAEGVVGGKGTSRRWGMTWIDVGNQRQGRGTVDFGGTSSARQRSCMTRPRCQVCGRRIVGTPRWIIPAERGWIDRDRRLTKQPPVCVPCADTAPVWCPHLRHVEHDVLDAVATPYGGIADVWDGSDFALTLVPLDHPARHLHLGRELVVRLD